jgi:predicted PurR-regulated permease PerM
MIAAKLICKPVFNTLQEHISPRWLMVMIFPILILNAWLVIKTLQYFQPLVAIVILAALLAFILNYPVQFLQQHGNRHSVAVVVVFLLTLLILIGLGITLVPRLIEELSQIMATIPDWIAASNQRLENLQAWAEQRHLPVSLSLLDTPITKLSSNGLQSIANPLLSLTMSTVGSATDIVFTIVLTFYFLLDGESIWKGIFQWMPNHVTTLCEQSLEQNFQNYIIGQITLASLMGSSMMVLFLLLKIPFALLFGLGIGVLTLIPLGGFLGMCLTGLIITIQDPVLGLKTFALALLIDQIIDQAIAPRLLGRFTGLRPAWILIALFIGTKLFGLLGLIVSVPLAGFVKDTLHELRNASVDTVIGLEAPATSDHSPLEKQQVQQL